MRGLKQMLKVYVDEVNRVASFTDAWIETESALSAVSKATVASFTDAWIETKFRLYDFIRCRSHLLQMRGLKQGAISCANLTYVASFTDAWIET